MVSKEHGYSIAEIARLSVNPATKVGRRFVYVAAGLKPNIRMKHSVTFSQENIEAVGANDPGYERIADDMDSDVREAVDPQSRVFIQEADNRYSHGLSGYESSTFPEQMYAAAEHLWDNSHPDA